MSSPSLPQGREGRLPWRTKAGMLPAEAYTAVRLVMMQGDELPERQLASGGTAAPWRPNGVPGFRSVPRGPHDCGEFRLGEGIGVADEQRPADEALARRADYDEPFQPALPSHAPALHLYAGDGFPAQERLG